MLHFCKRLLSLLKGPVASAFCQCRLVHFLTSASLTLAWLYSLAVSIFPYWCINIQMKAILAQAWSRALTLHVAAWPSETWTKIKTQILQRRERRTGGRSLNFRPSGCFLFGPIIFLNDSNNSIRLSSIKHHIRVRGIIVIFFFPGMPKNLRKTFVLSTPWWQNWFWRIGS